MSVQKTAQRRRRQMRQDKRSRSKFMGRLALAAGVEKKKGKGKK